MGTRARPIETCAKILKRLWLQQRRQPLFHGHKNQAKTTASSQISEPHHQSTPISALASKRRDNEQQHQQGDMHHRHHKAHGLRIIVIIMRRRIISIIIFVCVSLMLFLVDGGIWIKKNDLCEEREVKHAAARVAPSINDGPSAKSRKAGSFQTNSMPFQPFISTRNNIQILNLDVESQITTNFRLEAD